MSLVTNPFEKMNSESDEFPCNLSKTIPINELEDSYPFNNSEKKIKREKGLNPKFIISKQKRKDKEDNIRKKIKQVFIKLLEKT